MLKRLKKAATPASTKTTSLAEWVAAYGIGDALGTRPTASFRSNVVAYRCLRMITEAAASVPLQIREHGEVLTDGPLCDLIKRPSPESTAMTLFADLYTHLLTAGEAYVERVGNADQTLALFSIQPGLVEQEKSAYRIREKSGWRQVRPDANGRCDLLRLVVSGHSSEARGLAPLKVAADAIALHDAANAWNRQLLDNSARPSGALVHRGAEGNHLTPEQFDRLRRELDEGFTGMRGAGRPLLLDGGLDWRPMGLTPAELDFQNLKHSAARDIALAFGVPPMLLGIPGDNTYANYREANLAFWRQTVLPMVSRVTGALSVWLDPGRSARIEPDLAQLEALAPERSTRLDRIAAADFLTDAEKRAAFGYPSVPGVGR